MKRSFRVIIPDHASIMVLHRNYDKRHRPDNLLLVYKPPIGNQVAYCAAPRIPDFAKHTWGRKERRCK